MKKIILTVGFAFIISSCVSLNVRPAENMAKNEICVIENTGVNPDFTKAYLRQIKSNGYKAKLISVSEKASCEITSTYTATYGYHWGMYLATSQLRILQKGKIIGEANYRAPFASPSKHGRVEDKINEMVDQLLPLI